MVKEMKEKKPSEASLRKKKAKEIIVEIRRKLTGIQYGYTVFKDLEQLEKIVT